MCQCTGCTRQMPSAGARLPGGLNTDTGVIHGATIRASQTISFIGAKRTVHCGRPRSHCEQVTVHRSAWLRKARQKSPGAPSGLIFFPRDSGPDYLTALVPRDKRRDHRRLWHGWRSLLAARAALQLGSGRVLCLGLVDEQSPALDIQQPELMMRTPEAACSASLSALACGPGMGTAKVQNPS